MTQTVRVGIQGLRETQRDLEAVSLGLGRELARVIREGADSLVPAARSNTPFGPGPQSARDNLPHIGDTLSARASATTASIVSSHPGAPVHEYGGEIAPKGVPITIRQSAMAHRAGEQELPRFERDLKSAIDALVAKHDLA